MVIWRALTVVTEVRSLLEREGTAVMRNLRDGNFSSTLVLAKGRYYSLARLVNFRFLTEERGMGRIRIGMIRWVACAAIIIPVTECGADSPSPSEASVAAAAVTVPDDAARESADVKNSPRFKHASYPAAWTAAQESNRPILVYVSMPQCPHCTLMLDKTYEQPEVDELVKGSFETVMAGRYTHATLVSKLHVRWYPTTVLVGPNNKVLDMIEGYVDANTFKRRLQLGIASAHSTPTQTR